MRLRLVIPLVLLGLSGSPTAQAADAVPGEVVVGTERAGGDGPAFRTVETTDVAATIQRLRARDDVRYAVPNVTARASAFVPNDPGRGQGWQQAQWNFAGPFGIGMPAAWQHLIDAGRPGGRGVVVAVVDTGVAYADRGPRRRSPGLRGTRFTPGYDFVDDDPHPIDGHGHGTHVASTIAETTDDRRGLTGVAYGATIMPVRVLDDAGEGDGSVIARGIRFAARRGADVINLSVEFDSSRTAASMPYLLEAIAFARRRGALVVGAAGNSGETQIALPARSSRVLSVGATTERGCLFDFSNQGPGLTMVAPGGGPDAFLDDVLCRPDLAPGANVAQTTMARRGSTDFGIPNDFKGTSMSAPHVSGAAALVIASGILGENPSPAAITRRLTQTARDLGPPGRDARYGAGLLDAAAATNPAIPVSVR